MTMLVFTRVAAVTIAALVSASCSPAPTPTGATGTDVLVKTGIVGHWAVDCAQNYSGENPHLIYDISPSGLATEQLLMDPGHDRTTPLEDILELSGDMIQWTQSVPGGRVTVVTKIEAKTKQKTWTSTLSDGSVLISAGKYQGGGDAPWFNKCAGT